MPTDQLNLLRRKRCGARILYALIFSGAEGSSGARGGGPGGRGAAPGRAAQKRGVSCWGQAAPRAADATLPSPPRHVRRSHHLLLVLLKLMIGGDSAAA